MLISSSYPCLLEGMAVLQGRRCVLMHSDLLVQLRVPTARAQSNPG